MTNEIEPSISEFAYIRRVLLSRGVVVFGLIIILILIITAIFAPLMAPYDPYDQDLDQVLQQPSWEHLLGTDSLGRDTLSRIIYGSRNSLMVGLVALCIAATIGMTIGLVAGYFGGWINTVFMRFIDSLMCFPMILLALVLAALLGSGLRNVMIALGVAMLPGYARLMCGQVLSVKENDYVLAARSLGTSDAHIILRHILPNCLPPLIVLVTMQIGAAILAEAGLSFLGIGIEPPGAAWGTMINDGREYMLTNPILSCAPGLAIMLVVFSFNMVGDGMRDALDPRLRGTL
ncbi:MAG TPA: ABC transporter permease [Dehalococcoidia bacterium]|nr:ABC transporter permease [Dehalococcoidia bacterium]